MAKGEAVPNPYGRSAFTSALSYNDPMTALARLGKVFGFERVMLITDGNLAHSQMRFGEGVIMVGTGWTDYVASPGSTGGRGDRTFSMGDPEGHVWRFGQSVQQVSREDAEKASRLRSKAGLDQSFCH